MAHKTRDADGNVRPKVGVVLGSGGLKALAAIPLFECLDALHVDIDLLVGCSGGALLCAARAAGHSPASMRDLLETQLGRKLTSRIDYRAILGMAHPRLGRPGKPPGILESDRIREFCHRLFEGLRLEDLKPKTRLQATDLQSGEPVVLGTGPVADLVYASMACFPLLPPIRIGERWLVDGAFSSPLPVMEAVKRGMDVIIALDFAERVTSEPKGFLEFIHRSINATARALTRSQMALSIDLHHHEIVMIKVVFDQQVHLWDMAHIPAILEAGRQAIAKRRDDIVSAIDSFGQAARQPSGDPLDTPARAQSRTSRRAARRTGL